jgi:hypothetical protein
MPKVNTYGDAVADAQRLVAAMQDNASVFPNAETEKKELEDVLTQMQEAKVRQDFHTAERSRATQDLKAGVARYREAAIQIRAGAKAGLGVRSAKLAQFRVAPLRKPKPRTETATTTIKAPAAAKPVETAPAPAQSADTDPKP